MQYLANIKNFCKKIVPFIDFYKKQIDYYNKTVHDILTKEIPLILPNFPKNIKKRGIITSLVTKFIRLAYEGKSSYLHRCYIHGYGKPSKFRKKYNFSLEDLMVMYGIYNSDTLEKFINTVHKMHKTTTLNERLFAGKPNNWYQWYMSKDGVDHLCHKFSSVHNHNERKIC